MQAVFEGDAASAHGIFGQSAEFGYRFGDPDLLTLARHGQGRALIYLGEIRTGRLRAPGSRGATRADRY